MAKKTEVLRNVLAAVAAIGIIAGGTLGVKAAIDDYNAKQDEEPTAAVMVLPGSSAEEI